MKYIILCTALILAGCATPSTETRVARYPQATDMQPSPPLDQPADGSLASLYRYGVNAAHQYNDCRAHHNNLIEWVIRGDPGEVPPAPH